MIALPFHRNVFSELRAATLLAAACLTTATACSESNSSKSTSSKLNAERSAPSEKPSAGKSTPKAEGLARALELAREAQARIEAVDDYTCTFVKREMLDGELRDHEFIMLKVRHEPFSAYLHCKGPTMPKGQEVIYIDGRNDGEAWVHTTGFQGKLLGDMKLSPTGMLMMKDNRYPVTNIGIKNLIARQVAAYEAKKSPQDYQVKVLKCKVDGKLCRCVRVRFPKPTADDPVHTTKTYYEKKTGLPLRFERFDKPDEPDGEPVLVEEYTYQDLKINPGLTDDDFDPANPAYGYTAGD